MAIIDGDDGDVRESSTASSTTTAATAAAAAAAAASSSRRAHRRGSLREALTQQAISASSSGMQLVLANVEKQGLLRRRGEGRFTSGRWVEQYVVACRPAHQWLVDKELMFWGTESAFRKRKEATSTVTLRSILVETLSPGEAHAIGCPTTYCLRLQTWWSRREYFL